MISSPGFLLFVLALAAALGWRLPRPWGLSALLGALPLLAWLDILRSGFPPVSPFWLLGLALGDLLAKRTPAKKIAGARLWLALGLLALGQAIYLIWLVPYPDDGAAARALLRLAVNPFAVNANDFLWPLGAALTLLIVPVSLYAGARLWGDDPALRSRALRLGAQIALGAAFVMDGFTVMGAPGLTAFGHGRLPAGFPDPNSAGTFALVLVAILLATREPVPAAHHWAPRIWLGGALVLLLATGSRVAILSLPLLLAIHLARRGVSWKKILVWAPLALVAGWLALYAGYRIDQMGWLPVRVTGALTRLYQAITPDYLAQQGFAFRGSYWLASLRAFAHAPLTGVGIGRLYGTMGEYMRDMKLPVQYLHEHAHNQWLMWLSELGIIGLALALAGQWRSWRAADASGRLLQAALLLTFLTGHPLLVPALGVLYGLILSGAQNPNGGGNPGQTPARLNWRSGLPLLALPLGLLLARPPRPFKEFVQGEGAPLPELAARWSLRCGDWNEIMPPASAPQRLGDPAQRAGAISVLQSPQADERHPGLLTARVRVQNRSRTPWPALHPCSGSVEFVHLAYHWKSRTGGAAIEGDRTPLSGDLAPGEIREMEMGVRPPPAGDDYEFVPDALQEGVAWFELPVSAAP